MSLQVIKQRKRGFICVNAHPEGCRRNIGRQVEAIRQAVPKPFEGVKNALIIGASTGYGLASRIAAAWAFGAKTLGVFFERAPKEGSTATAGYYNTMAFHEQAREAALYAASLNGDAFSDDLKRQAAEIIRKDLAPLDLVIYSLASPRRIHPRTGQTHNAVLKPIGREFTSKTIDLNTEKVVPVTLEPAAENEIEDTVAVMGGDDWQLWMEMLASENLLACGARTVAYSYIGPEVTWPIYRDGTIGRAKLDLEKTARRLNTTFGSKLGLEAFVSVNKAVVTQASAAIPVVPLYLSVLPRVLKNNEQPIGQMRRLFVDFLAGGDQSLLVEPWRVRLDTAELSSDVQAGIARIWPVVTTENLYQQTDFTGFKRAFDNLFGFDVEGVDYSQSSETESSW
ncbi:MAG: bifunctional NADH-specific enoyl-ACP reductase/trans-2-enoyl-CoA reductase [Acidobacteria bacterium]|nr:MAG: bifunctional NADH-specific enoyl-ACP reductase/trans-2-enoyl-CoA reductase [Acidobacteriota bacterium]